MPFIKSGWLLPTGEFICLGNLSHSEIVIKFLAGLFMYDEVLAAYCLRDFKNFIKRADYKDLELSDAIEDYAVLCLRWIKIGNAYNYYNNRTTTIANYDMFSDKISYYKNIGYHVNIIEVKIHCYETIDQREYEKLNVREVIANGDGDYQEYFKNI